MINNYLFMNIYAIYSKIFNSMNVRKITDIYSVGVLTFLEELCPKSLCHAYWRLDEFNVQMRSAFYDFINCIYLIIIRGCNTDSQYMY